MDQKYRLNRIDVKLGESEIMDSYTLNDRNVKVFITKDGKYLIREPEMPQGAEELYDLIIRKIDMSFKLESGENSSPDMLASKFEEAFWDTTKRLNREDEAKDTFRNISYYIKRDIMGFRILDALMRDPQIEDILCSAYGREIMIVHKEYSGKFHTLETNVKFATATDMEQFIQRIYGKTGSEPTESNPISVTYMDDGSRISCTFGSQVSKPGPVIAIRKFPEHPLSITNMLESKTISFEVAAYIWTLLDAKAVGLVIGVTGSGKTTLLSSFMTMINPRWRVLTIEDTLELQIPHKDWVRYHTRKSYGMISDRYDIPIRRLIDSSLTQKPDFEVIGEIRLEDMDMLFQSVGTGHGGLTSFHASSPTGALTRMRGNKISDGELALTWFVVHTRVVELDSGKVRRVNDVSEVTADPDSGKISIRKVYEYDVFGDVIKNNIPLNECERYMESINICGIKDAKKDMEYRISLLQECVEKEVYDHKRVFGILGRYYEKGSK